jgi:hypothetical protein
MCAHISDQEGHATGGQGRTPSAGCPFSYLDRAVEAAVRLTRKADAARAGCDELIVADAQPRLDKGLVGLAVQHPEHGQCGAHRFLAESAWLSSRALPHSLSLADSNTRVCSISGGIGSFRKQRWLLSFGSRPLLSLLLFFSGYTYCRRTTRFKHVAETHPRPTENQYASLSFW